MSLMLAYWIVFLIGILVGTAPFWNGPPWLGAHGSGIIALLLFLILGWAVFGVPIRG